MFLFYWLCALIIGITQVVNGTDCPDGWLAFNSSCYLFGHDSLHFVEAERFCEHHDSHLVHIDDISESTFITSFLTDLKDQYHWIGLTDDEIDGLWKWLDDGSLATFTNWYPGKPTRNKNANCAITYPALGYKWVDLACTSLHHPLCEQESSSFGPAFG